MVDLGFGDKRRLCKPHSTGKARTSETGQSNNREYIGDTRDSRGSRVSLGQLCIDLFGR